MDLFLLFTSFHLSGYIPDSQQCTRIWIWLLIEARREGCYCTASVWLTVVEV